MFFEDGPFTFKPDFSSGDLFSSPRGLSSVAGADSLFPFGNVGSLDAKMVARNIRHYRAQVESFLSLIPSFFESVVDYNREAPNLKSTAKSVQFRKEGNQAYSRKDFYGALDLYTKSMANAEEGSAEQMLAYGNRSAVLFHLREYVPCLLDVNRVLNLNCSEELKKKMVDRKERCLDLINDESISADMTDLIKVPNPTEETEWANLCNFDNPLIPNASSKIKINSNESWGRHLIATEDIEAGEILSSQKFDVLTVRPDKKYDHCSYCLVKCLALIPCSSCPEALYCSTDCRTTAYNSYHRVECKMNTNHEKSLKQTAVRNFLIGTEQGAQLKNLMRKLPRQDLFRTHTDPSNEPFVNDYIAVLNMSRTYNQEVGSFFSIFVDSMLNVLNGVGFFEDSLSQVCVRGKLSNAELYAGMLIMNHAIALKSHTFAISPISELECLCQNVIGIGVCTLHSFINHSCYPNVRFFNRNREHILLSVRPIKKGEQLFHSYLFQSFETVPIEKRKQMLSMFFGFDCKCEACSGRWLTINAFSPRSPLRFLGQNKMDARKNLLEMLLPIMQRNIEDLSRLEMLQVLKRVVGWFHANFMKPAYGVSSCEVLLFQFLALSYDNISHSQTLITTDDLKKFVIGTLLDLEKTVVRVIVVNSEEGKMTGNGR